MTTALNYGALLCTLLVIFIGAAQAQMQEIKGRVTSESGKGIEGVNIQIEGTAFGTASADDGRYVLRSRYVKKANLVFSKIGFKTVVQPISFQNANDSLVTNVKLTIDYTAIDEVQVQGSRKAGNLQRLEAKDIHRIPSVSGTIETLLKTMPGVFSHNELSTQYTVRGGNFDENLVYVNGIEVYRPFLIRTGEQEGLSFVNPDMVQSVYFSAGGFNPEYGDKMSSVLDITYKKPQKFAGSLSGGLLGGSFHLENAMLGGKLSQITGVRYKNSTYLLNSLESTGDYRPSYLDLQSYWSLTLNEKWSVNFLGTTSSNKFFYKPEDRETNFGTKDDAQTLYIDFEGQERDKYNTYTGALRLEYKPFQHVHLGLTASGFYTNEEETFDLAGAYLLSAKGDEQPTDTREVSGVVDNLGIGRFINHGRNYLQAQVMSIQHNGKIVNNETTWNWGIRFQNEKIKDSIHEWEMLDSAGYSLPAFGHGKDPLFDGQVDLTNVSISQIDLNSNRLSAYVQANSSFENNSFNFKFVGGMRAKYWSYNHEWIFSPRANLSIQPKSNPNIDFRIAAGRYYQQAFYRELRERDGSLSEYPFAQRSIHLVVGSDYRFKLWDRPMKLSTEMYYKFLSDLVPYEIDNLRIRYFPDQTATGYATGIDLKLNGEFVKGTDSWVSVSLMKSSEDIEGDDAGYIPRPTDQRFQIVAFFQDYFPNNDTWKINLAGHYANGLPFGPPASERKNATYKLPPYKRVDIAISKKLFNRSGKRIFGAFSSVWFSAEVFNLLGINNTISYLWARVVPNTASLSQNYAQIAVPNRLTGRRLNFKFTLRF